MNHPNTETYLTDKILIDRVLRGDARAFEEIIRSTEGLVAQIVFKMVKNIEDRRDVAQDIYVRVYRGLPGFRYQSKLSTWIARVGYTTCLNYLEKKRLVLPDVFPEGPGTDGEFRQEPDVQIFKKDLSGILQAEMDKLPPIYRTLLVLFHQEELHYEEIAQITGLPEGTLKSYLFRARKALKEKLLLKYKKEEL